jgi:pimeloyl-ACP methyl ester carboxylesterase
MPVFRYKNADVYYDLYGHEGDPTIVFINGLSMRTSHWAPYFKLLPEKGVRVLTYDMLGQGASSKPVLGVSFDDHAIILKALQDHLGLKQIYVMGISFGGVVALRYAIMFPDAVKGLLPISTFSELDPQLLGHASNLYNGMVRVGFEFYLDLLMPLNFSNEWLSKNQSMLSIIKHAGASINDIYGIQNLMESLRDFQSITPQLKGIKAPTLVINAEYDAFTPRHLHDIMRSNTPNSRMLIVPKMCHAFTLEMPALCSRIFAEFINQVETGAWQGDQTVWVVNEDPDARELAYQCPGDHLRYVPTLDSQGFKPIKTASWSGKPATTAQQIAGKPKPAPRKVVAKKAAKAKA